MPFRYRLRFLSFDCGTFSLSAASFTVGNEIIRLYSVSSLTKKKSAFFNHYCYSKLTISLFL